MLPAVLVAPDVAQPDVEAGVGQVEAWGRLLPSAPALTRTPVPAVQQPAVRGHLQPVHEQDRRRRARLDWAGPASRQPVHLQQVAVVRAHLVRLHRVAVVLRDLGLNRLQVVFLFWLPFSLSRPLRFTPSLLVPASGAASALFGFVFGRGPAPDLLIAY